MCPPPSASHAEPPGQCQGSDLAKAEKVRWGAPPSPPGRLPQVQTAGRSAPAPSSLRLVREHRGLGGPAPPKLRLDGEPCKGSLMLQLPVAGQRASRPGGASPHPLQNSRMDQEAVLEAQGEPGHGGDSPRDVRGDRWQSGAQGGHVCRRGRPLPPGPSHQPSGDWWPVHPVCSEKEALIT